MKKLFALMLLITMVGVAGLQGATPKGGMGAAAMSPDGKMLVVGGDNRVLYLVDPNSGEVNQRIWFKSNIYEMAFNKNGSTLVVEDTSDTLYFLDTKTWKTMKKVVKAGSMSAAPAADIVAGLASGYKASSVKFLSMTNGAPKGEVKFPGKVYGIGLNPAGTRLVLLADGPKDAEKKNKTPKGIKGLEADNFKQKNDGKVSILAEYEVPSGKEIRKETIFYKVNRPLIVVGDKAVAVFCYSNVNALIKGKDIKLFKGESSYNYGMGVSPDRKSVLLGGLRSGTRVDASNLDNMLMSEFNINKLPGWPEYYKGFGFAADGTGYGVTTAYRLVIVDKNGSVKKTVPIY